MDTTLDFIPLKKYRRAAVIGLCISILVAAFLCLHFYHLKLTRAYEERVAHFQALDAQFDQRMAQASSVLDGVFLTLEQAPIDDAFESIEPKAAADTDYFYQKLSHSGVEFVGFKHFRYEAVKQSQWYQLSSLAPAFNTVLSLMSSVEAIAYVKEGHYAFVKRRASDTSHMLSALLEGELEPDFSMTNFSSSRTVKINGERFFSIAKQRGSAHNEYVILVYSVERVAGWLESVSLGQSQVLLINKDKRNILDAQRFEFKSPIQQQGASPWSDGIELYELKSQRPLDLVYLQQEFQFRKPILYELALEFAFILLFVLATYMMLSWLCHRIFILPVSYFVRYLTHQEQSPQSTFDYVIPIDWQPWFAQVKQVVMQKESLLLRLQLHNEELDEEVQKQRRALSRSLDAKERQAALLDKVLDTVPDLIYFKNIDGSFIGCNRAFEQFLGVEKSQLVGREHQEVTELYPELLLLEQKMRDQQYAFTTTLQLDEKSYMLTLAPFLDGQKGLLGTLGVARDVTEQQRAMRALQTSEENFKAAMEYAPNGVILVSLKQTVLVMNKAAKRYLGKVHNESHAHLSSMFNSDSYLAISHLLNMLLKDSKKVLELSLSQPEPFKWLHLSASLVWDKNKTPKYYVLHLQDITSLTQAKLDAERATLAKSRFIANISHEIRTPLNVIQGLVDIVKKQGVTEQQQVHLGQVEHASDQLLNMLDSILSYAKVEGRVAVPCVAEFCIATLVKDCLELITPLSEKKQLQLITQVDERVWPILNSNENRIKQILINLLNNAVKYTEHGQITLSMEVLNESEEKQDICFCVSDTGVGIKPQDQNRLFDAFTQGDESFSRYHEGIGLGLAIVKHEVASLGSHIELKSELGQGSQFFFTLSLDKVPTHIFEENVPVLCLCSKEREMPFLSHPHIQVVHSANQALQALKQGVYRYLVLADSPDARVLLNEHDATLQALEQIIAPDSLTDFTNSRLTFVNANVFMQGAVCLLGRKLEVNALHKLGQKVAGKLCLVVDDNSLNLDIAANMLQSLHVNVVVQQSAKMLTELVATLQPDIVLMDIHMPGVDGYQATSDIRDVLQEFESPIIALTANSQLSEKERALEVGMNDYLTKPISQTQLQAALQTYMHSDEVFFDNELALQQMMGSDKFLDSMLDKFALMCAEYLSKLEQDGDDMQLETVAHSVKGAAGGIGFIALSEAAKALEWHLKEFGSLQQPALKEVFVKRLNQVKQFIPMRYRGA